MTKERLTEVTRHFLLREICLAKGTFVYEERREFVKSNFSANQISQGCRGPENRWETGRR